jgi:hypothetical protein
MPVVRWRTEPVHVKQGGQTRFNTFEFGPIIASYQAMCLIPPEEPMIQSAHNVRNAAPIRVKATGAEWGDELACANLFISHGNY